MTLRPTLPISKFILLAAYVVAAIGLAAPNYAFCNPASLSWQEEEEDPFAEPQEEEDPFAEPQEEEEDPFAEPNVPDEPMDPQEEEEDPFSEPKPEPTEPTEPKPDPVPAPMPDPVQPKPQPVEPATGPAADPKPAPTTEPVIPPLIDSAGSGTKEGSTTKEGSGTKPLESTPNLLDPAGSGNRSLGSDKKESNSPLVADPNNPFGGSDNRNTGNDSQPFDPLAGSKSNPSSGDVAYDQFQKLIQEIRINEQRVNQLVITMPVGFPEKRELQKRQIEALRNRNLSIRDQLLPVAKRSFEDFPNTQPQITNFLLQNIQVMLTGRNYRKMPFDPFAALEACETMIAGGVKNPTLYSFRYRSNYILNEFPEAGRSVQKAVMLGQQIDPKIFDDLKEINKRFEIEKELRQQDAANGNPQVRIETDSGVMLVELFEDQAPNTVANFITLVQDGFYNGLSFYQANPTEIVLTGSPSDDGRGGPGYQIKSEAKLENARSHFTGTLSMMASGDISSGSLFLITKQPRLQYDGKITPFGRIIEGMENLYQIKIVNRTANLTKNDPTKPTKIIRMTVVKKRNHEYVPEKILPPRTGG